MSDYELLEAVNEFIDSSVASVDELGSVSAVKWFSQQRNSARKIISNFKNNISYNILLAPMQSGKTGTYMYVSLKMLFEKDITDVILIS